MRVLIVYAHPEPRSFGASLLQTSVDVLREQGHQVQVSDLYAMGFDPVAGPDDFTSRRFPDALQYDREQKHAHQHQAFAADIQAEIDKLLACELLILQFPLWWFSVPAMMKGWIDRVFVNGVAYGKGQRMDNGGLKGRRAMLVLTTACYPDMVAEDGLLGGLDVNLWHLQSGTLAYVGFDVLPPFVAWSIHYVDEARRRVYLDEFAQRLRCLDSAVPIAFHRLAEFGADWRLKPEVEPRTAGQRRGTSGFSASTAPATTTTPRARK